MFEAAAESKGEKAGFSKAWTKAVLEPTKCPTIEPTPPDVNYKLDYVFGYRTYDCRENLYLQ